MSDHAGSDRAAVRFRPLERRDFRVLAGWLARPHVREWWREDPRLDRVEATYGPSVDGLDPTELVIVETDGGPVGFMQWYLLSDNPEWMDSLSVAGDWETAAGIDYLVGEEEAVGRGLGPMMIDAFVDERLARYPEVGSVVVSVHQDNRRSWRALEKAGFSRIWSGEIVSADPSDEGPSFVYERPRG